MIQEVGGRYIEVSTDNECDPLFNPPEYLSDWINDVKKAQQKLGMKVVNFYTGYQTYRTVGLAHHDERVRKKLFQGWLQPMVNMAAQLEAGIGFSFHAFPVEVLQSPEIYEQTKNLVIQALAEFSIYAWDQGKVTVSVEQMYAPHQAPWTIKDSKGYLKDIYRQSQKPVYITINVGHQVGQRKFLRPGSDTIQAALKTYRAEKTIAHVWLGPESAYTLFIKAAELPENQIDSLISQIEREMDRYPYLFAEYDDGNPYKWLEELGCYSPIMHLQQNNGFTSHHAHFTEENNQTGIIQGDKVLQAIARSYEKEAETGMPPKCEAIYLAFEIFASNTDLNHDIMNQFKESVQYWRQFIPQDGLPLNELL